MLPEVLFLLFIKETVLQCIRAVRAGSSLACPLVLLDGLIEAIKLTEQGHIQLAEANLEGREEIKVRNQHWSLVLLQHPASCLPAL